MPRRKTTPARPPLPAAGPLARMSVLVVASRREHREALVARINAAGPHAVGACDTHTAVAMLHTGAYDATIIDADHPQTHETVTLLMQTQPSNSCILIAQTPDFEAAVAAMRAGACDLLDADCNDQCLTACLTGAYRRSRAIRFKERTDQRRSRRLRAANRELALSRQALLGQLGSVCKDMAGACRDVSDQMKSVALAAELNTIFRQELDLESLLRTVLEYTLRKVGSTNAAIFLPSTTGDFTLGAYVNYDCPRDTAETLLDHLADIIAPAFEHRDDIATMRGLSGLRAEPGSGGEWLEDSTITAFACRQDNECLGVVVLFRDRRSPFDAAAMEKIRIIRDLFGQQLARVIRTHHRHLPKNQWGGFFGEKAGPDDLDIAA